MLDAEFGRYLPGRHCPLTEDRCHMGRCQSKCYGFEAAKQLKNIMHLNPAYASRAFNSVTNGLPIETIKAIGKYLDGEGQYGSDAYEDFMDELLE